MKWIVKMSLTQLFMSLPFCSQNASAGVERLLLGNKCDMEAKRKVQKEQAEKVSVGGRVGQCSRTAERPR